MHETNHPHSHPHTHGAEAHSHEHEHGAFESPEQAQALMAYMLDHNRHHAEELHDVCHRLEDMGKTAAAASLGAALDAYYHGNEHLEEALKALREAE